MSLRRTDGERLFPSWKGLLEKADERVRCEGSYTKANLIKAHLDDGDYQKAADYARQGLEGTLWNLFFQDVFGIKRAEINDASLELPRAIWTLSDRVITLNYDKVMRFANPCSDDVVELDNTSIVELPDFNRNAIDSPTIWHLHGRLENKKEIIFTSESYSKLYLEKESSYKAALEIFRSICRDSHLLFVGCSLDDAELLEQIARQHALFAGNTGPHYALVHEKYYGEIQRKLDGLKIHLISFADFGQPLLDKIASITKGSAAIPEMKPVAHQKLTSPVYAEQPRIAVLSANPIAKNYQYDPLLLKEIKSFKCEVSYFPLNIKSLNALDGFDYIVILSKLVKKRIVIEDEMLQNQSISFKELEDNIANSSTNGVMIFLDHADTTALDADDIAALNLPTLIFPHGENGALNSLNFKLFKKAKLDAFSDGNVYCLANASTFTLQELKGKCVEVRSRSKLPDSIDPKSTIDFVGRGTDLESLCRKIIELQAKEQVLTIKGSGGIGKTMTIKKIAVELACRGFFPEGIDFIDCEFISDYATFEKKVASNFNLENALHIRQQIKENFSKQEKLIILDNVETLLYLGEKETIKDFINFICDYATIVITSREVLDMDCEDVYELRDFTTDEAFDLFMQELTGITPHADEQKFIRTEIVETLLGNNPLAIKLVAKNIPKGKKFTDLKDELENDIFRKASESELADFDRVSDGNIQRKNSLYASIHFSYRNLNENEKKVFEILSLFPDGINLVNLRRMAENRSDEQRRGSKKLSSLNSTSIITDALIKSLEKKSMTQVDNNNIKLQSIVGKFAEFQLKERSEKERTQYYQNAANYLIVFAQFLYKMQLKEMNLAFTIFNEYQENFMKSIQYIDVANIEKDLILDYLDVLNILTCHTSLSGPLFHAMEKKSDVFEGDATAKLCFNVIKISASYFAGNFKSAFAELQQQIPLETAEESDFGKGVRELIVTDAMDIYGMEGGQLSLLVQAIKRNWFRNTSYPADLLQLGVIDSSLIAASRVSFHTLEAKFVSGQLTIGMVTDYLAGIYDKNHLEKMQTYYLKAKLGEIDRHHIKKLVVVNPYTAGLQQIMFAIIETNLEKKIALFEAALSNLQHIKYYYVEALLYYARHLQKSEQVTRYQEIYKQGLQLACHHHYRFLRYQFEDLEEKKTVPYSPDTYPLPEVGDLKGHLQMLTKRVLEQK